MRARPVVAAGVVDPAALLIEERLSAVLKMTFASLINSMLNEYEVKLI